MSRVIVNGLAGIAEIDSCHKVRNLLLLAWVLMFTFLHSHFTRLASAPKQLATQFSYQKKYSLVMTPKSFKNDKS